MKDGGQDTGPERKDGQLGIVEVKADDENDINDIESDKNAEKDPGWSRWKKQGVASSWVVEEKA